MLGPGAQGHSKQPGETGQPSQAPGHEPLTAYALHFILQGAAATLLSLLLLQEHFGLAIAFSEPATGLSSVPVHCHQQPQTSFSCQWGDPGHSDLSPFILVDWIV